MNADFHYTPKGKDWCTARSPSFFKPLAILTLSNRKFGRHDINLEIARGLLKQRIQGW